MKVAVSYPLCGLKAIENFRDAVDLWQYLQIFVSVSGSEILGVPNGYNVEKDGTCLLEVRILPAELNKDWLR